MHPHENSVVRDSASMGPRYPRQERMMWGVVCPREHGRRAALHDSLQQLARIQTGRESGLSERQISRARSKARSSSKGQEQNHKAFGRQELHSL